MNARHAALFSFGLRGQFGHPRDPFQTGADLGFIEIELRTLRGDTLNEESRPGDFQFTSLHAPAPLTLSVPGIGPKDWRRTDVVHGSLEPRRSTAVATIRGLIDVAADCGAGEIASHAATECIARSRTIPSIIMR